MNEFENDFEKVNENNEDREELREQPAAKETVNAAAATETAKEEPAAFVNEPDPAEAVRRAVEWERRFESEAAAARREQRSDPHAGVPYPPEGHRRPEPRAEYYNNAPDYRAAYGQRYDPYEGRRPERPGYVPGYEAPGVHTYVNDNQPRGGGYAPSYQYSGAQAKPAEKKAKEKRNKDGFSRRAMAWMIALCILLSAGFGAGGVYVGSLIARGGESSVRRI